MTRSKLIGAAPVLLVRDVVASANYYRDQLGFHYEQFWGDPPCFTIVDRDGQVLMLSQVDNTVEIVPNHQLVDNLWNAYFWVDDAEKLFTEFKQHGAQIDYELCDQPYGCREFGIQDLDGYDIAFGQDLGN